MISWIPQKLSRRDSAVSMLSKTFDVIDVENILTMI